MDVFVELRATISEFKSKMQEARGEMSSTESHFSNKFQSLGRASGVALAGVAGAAIAVGGAFLKMGNDLEDSRAKLDVALKDTHSKLTALSPPIQDADKAMEKFGFTNAQTNEAIAAGTVATGSATKALSMLQLAANLAAFKNVDLTTAMVAVSKASEGNLRPLKQLGMDLPVVASSAQKVMAAETALSQAEVAAKVARQNLINVTDKHKASVAAVTAAQTKYQAALAKVATDQQKLSALQSSGSEILKILNQRLGGQAASAADTFSGKLKVAKAQVEDMGAKIGVKLIPIVERLIMDTMKVIGWFERHQAAAKALAGVIAGVLATAVAVFTINKLAALVRGVQGVIGMFKTMGSQATTTAAETEAASTGMASKFSGAMTVIAAGALAFQGTTALLKSNFLGIGDAVNSAAKAISDFFGGVGQVHPSTSLTPQAIQFYENVAAGTTYAANITPSQAQQALHQEGVPGYAAGTSYVPRTGLALLHRGEAVIPAGNRGGDLVLQIGTTEFGRIAGPAVRAWLLQQPGRNASRGRLTVTPT